ncbi:NACHT domain-containing protein [Streptomyces sp. NPDC002643]
MGYALHPRKVRIVTGPPEAGPLRELWTHCRRPFAAAFWHLRCRWLLHRGVTHARRWWNPPWTTALVGLVVLMTLALLAWAFVAVLDLMGKTWVVNGFGPHDLCQESGGNDNEGNNASACDAVSGIAMPTLLLAASTVLFLSWRLWQVRRFCTRQARHDPARLVQTAGSLMDEVVGRDQLCDAIMKNLGDKKVRRPHVVVGGVGVGKTALLVRLAQRLAAVGAVPVPVRLRDAQGEDRLDFDELALARFREIVRSKVRSDGEVDRIWRWLRQRADRIVVLADGLEEAFSSDEVSGRRDNLIRDAIRRAGEEGLPLVIASRPHEPLRAMQAAVSELEPLSNEAALRYIAGSGSWRSDPALLDRIVEATDMVESPIYLKIAKDLHAKDLLEPLWTGGGDPDLRLHDSWRLRAALMERWVRALVEGDVHPELPIDHDTRLAVVEYLSALACVGLASDSADVRLGDLSRYADGRGAGPGGLGYGVRSGGLQEWNTRVAAKLDRRIAALRWQPASPDAGATATADAGATADTAADQNDTTPSTAAQKDPSATHDDASSAERHHTCLRPQGDTDWWLGPRVDIRIAATWGTRMGLVHENGDQVRFQHSIVQAYLGSRFLDVMFDLPEPKEEKEQDEQEAQDEQEPPSPADGERSDEHITGALRRGGRELLIALTLYSRTRKGRCVCDGAEVDDPRCPVNRMRALLTKQAGKLLDDAQRSWSVAEQSPATADGGFDDRGSPRLRALELYGAAVEIDSVGAAPRQRELISTIQRHWMRLGQDEDPARLREAKLTLVRQCGTAVRRVTTDLNGSAGQEPAAHQPYGLLFRIGREETDRRVREALIKEVGSGGEPAYQELCDKLEAPCATVATRRECGGRNEPHPAEGSKQCAERRLAEEEALAEKGKWACDTMRAWLLPLLVDSSMMSRHLASPRDDLDNWVRTATRAGPRAAPHTGLHDNVDGPHLDPDGTHPHGTHTGTHAGTPPDGIHADGPGAAVGLGVALAQGFKYAANRRPGPSSNPRAREFLVKHAQELLKESSFWYTRLTLLHALTLWSLPDDVNADQPMRGHGSDPKGQVREWLAQGDGSREEHPLVAGAAKLAVRALQTRRPERFLWIDEATVVSCIGTEVGLPGEPRAHNLWIPSSTGWSTLDPRAQQLLADVLLLLVLGERAHRPKDAFRILERRAKEPTHMPSCVRRDRTRLSPVRGAERAAQPGSHCTDDCRMKMCPYPAKVENLRAEFSEVFCLQQRDLLKKWQPWSWAAFRFRREAPWQRDVPIAGMRRFWDQMSDRARDAEPRPLKARGAAPSF